VNPGGLESFPVGLDHSDGDEAGLPGLDVFHGAGFAGVNSADDFALGAVGYLMRLSWFFHGRCC
jgi:hypothetical protein